MRNKDGSMDLEVPLTASQHAQLLEGVERECKFTLGWLGVCVYVWWAANGVVADVHMRRATAELVKRHQVDLKQRLPGRCCAGSQSRGGGLIGWQSC